jgi:hypothetical protein
VEVIISPAGDEQAQDMASLRAWLEAGGGVAWTLAPEATGDGSHLGFGVDEICAVIAAVEGLPSLISAIKGWFTTREKPEPVTLTITVDPDTSDVTVTVPAKKRK